VRSPPDRFVPGPTRPVVFTDGDIVDATTGTPVVADRSTISLPTTLTATQKKVQLWNEARALGWSKEIDHASSTKPKLDKFIKGKSAVGATPILPDLSSSSSSSSGSGVKMSGRGGASTTRLQVLVGSIEAGNRGKALTKQVMEMSDELLIAGKLSKSQHKQIYDRYVK
jgi:hypothetical protein